MGQTSIVLRVVVLLLAASKGHKFRGLDGKGSGSITVVPGRPGVAAHSGVVKGGILVGNLYLESEVGLKQANREPG